MVSGQITGKQKDTLRTRSRELAGQRLAGLQDQSKQPKDDSLIHLHSLRDKKNTERSIYSWVALAPFWATCVPNT